MIGGIIIIIVWLLIVFLGNSKKEVEAPSLLTEPSNHPTLDESDIVYNGASNDIGLEEIEPILKKRYPYYVSLDPDLKEKFLERTQNFMRKKIFIMKNNEGYKEMPILVSAAAIQLTFGLNDYLLPFYKYIQIYPREYLGDGLLKILAGNVENNVITIAWNQFLKGNEDLTDGSNVGLHEMSHALYFEKLIVEGAYAKDFCANYNHLLTACKEAYQTEITGQKNLYSDYADTDLQEFWAESVEISFECPGELCTQYPAVYEAMKALLNQDPSNSEYPIIQTSSSLSQKVSRLLTGQNIKTAKKTVS